MKRSAPLAAIALLLALAACAGPTDAGTVPPDGGNPGAPAADGSAGCPAGLLDAFIASAGADAEGVDIVEAEPSEIDLPLDLPAPDCIITVDGGVLGIQTYYYDPVPTPDDLADLVERAESNGFEPYGPTEEEGGAWTRTGADGVTEILGIALIGPGSEHYSDFFALMGGTSLTVQYARS
jgi:hypothetical protein